MTARRPLRGLPRRPTSRAQRRRNCGGSSASSRGPDRSPPPRDRAARPGADIVVAGFVAQRCEQAIVARPLLGRHPCGGDFAGGLGTRGRASFRKSTVHRAPSTSGGRGSIRQRQAREALERRAVVTKARRRTSAQPPPSIHGRQERREAGSSQGESPLVFSIAFRSPRLEVRGRRAALRVCLLSAREPIHGHQFLDRGDALLEHGPLVRRASLDDLLHAAAAEDHRHADEVSADAIFLAAVGRRARAASCRGRPPPPSAPWRLPGRRGGHCPSSAG